MLTPFPESSNYRSEIRSILQLHRLWLDGKGESEEADALRDAGSSWELLSDVERKRIRGLSEDLNWILDHPTSENTLDLNPQAQSKLVEAQEACQRGEWDRALELLRRWGKHVTPALLCYLRGKFWFEAGDPEVAAAFVEHAKDLEPDNATYYGAWLSALRRSDSQKAIAAAELILQDIDSKSPKVLVFASNILFEFTEDAAEARAAPTYRRLIPVVSRALQKLEGNPDKDIAALKMAFSLLALCYLSLGDRESAIANYTRALETSPNDAGLLVDRAALLYGGTETAVSDLEFVLQLGYRDILPYFVLAHYYLANGRYGDCRRMCEQGLLIEGPQAFRSELYEWLAVSQAQLGYPVEVVRESFELAIQTNPSNDRARRNLAKFEASFTDNHAIRRPWETLPAADLRILGEEVTRKRTRWAA